MFSHVKNKNFAETKEKVIINFIMYELCRKECFMIMEKTELLVMVRENNFDKIKTYLCDENHHINDEYQAFFELISRYPLLHMTRKRQSLCLECIHLFIDKGIDIYSEKILVSDKFLSVFQLINNENLSLVFSGGAHKYAEWLPGHLAEYQIKSQKERICHMLQNEKRSSLKNNRI